MKQENASNDSTVTESELRDAGASATYIAYYLQAQEMGINTASTRHAEKVVNRDISYSGGGFHDSLWDADPRYPHNSQNPYGADNTNKKILREAGVHPYAGLFA